MRHGNSKTRLGRQSSHRKAVLTNLVKSVLLRQRIKTTVLLAKQSRRLTEKMITLGKKNTVAARRQAFALLNDRDLVARLFNDVAPRFADRAGGYTRIVHAGNRRGDNADMAILELTVIHAAAEKKSVQNAAARSGAVTAEPVDDKEIKQKGFISGIKKFLNKQEKDPGAK